MLKLKKLSFRNSLTNLIIFFFLTINGGYNNRRFLYAFLIQGQEKITLIKTSHMDIINNDGKRGVKGSEGKLNETLTKLKEAKQEIEAFATETNDKNTQKLYQDGADQIKQIVNSVSGRSDYVEKQNQKEQTNNLDLE